MSANQPAVLLLEDGRVFTGLSFGYIGQTIGEVCFNTGMSGYQEILTDPSYCKQIVTMTAPHIGNYGINPKDIESEQIQVSGFAIKEETTIPSNWRSTQSIGDYLNKQKIVGIKSIDTRSLTRHIRNHGAMNGIISSTVVDVKSLKTKLLKAPSMNGLDLAKEVSTKQKFRWSKNNKKMNFTVAAIDYGIKHNILRLLEKNSCDITVFPARTTAKEIIKFNPDGIFLSNGPGDPAAVTYGISMVKDILGKKPILVFV